MNGVLRPVDNSGHIGHTYILNIDAKWKKYTCHLQQHMTNITNDKWNETQNDAPFVAVTFVLSGETADVSIAGLQCFFLIP